MTNYYTLFPERITVGGVKSYYPCDKYKFSIFQVWKISIRSWCLAIINIFQVSLIPVAGVSLLSNPIATYP